MTWKIEIPKECPSCGCTLVIVNEQLFCKSQQCGAKSTKSIEHFASTLKIKGLGPATIEKLSLDSIESIYEIDEQYLINTLGEKLGHKLYLEIEKSKIQPFEILLAAFGIPLIGKTVAEKLSLVVETLDQISEDTCKQAKLGPKATDNLLTWLRNNKVELPITISKRSESRSTSIICCISGSLTSFKTKAKAKEFLSELGVQCVDNISKKVTYIISEDGKISSKVNKAIEYNIPVITINSLKEKLKYE